MNDFPVIGDPCFAHRILGSPGGKHYESLQRNVWRGVVSPLKAVSLTENAAFCCAFKRNGGDLYWGVEISSFCAINAINSIDKHSLREVGREIYIY